MLPSQQIGAPTPWARLSGDDLDCPPRFGTRRTPERATYGPRQAQIAANMGKPFQPWQHYVANTAGEVDPITGRLVYGIVVLTLPRQQGKTHLTIPAMTHRCLAWSRQIVVYTAQTKDEALKKLKEDHEPMLAESPYLADYAATWNNNDPHLRWANGSRWGVQASTKSAGHGPTLHLGVLDEAWAQTDGRIEQAWLPAMMTTDSQMWIVSTAGTEDSTWFNEKVEAGRDLVRAGHTVDIAHFEWSADPKSDPFDPATWYTCMPALGNTVTEAKIRQAQLSLASKPGEFARAYCNITKGSEKIKTLEIDMEAWEALADPRSRIGQPLAYGVEVAMDRSAVSVAVAGVRPDGRMHVEVIAHRSGIDWVVPYLVVRARRWRPVGIGVDLGGPAGSLKAALLKAGFRIWSDTMDAREAAKSLLTAPTVREYAAASEDFYDAIGTTEKPRTELVHLGAAMQPQLTRACAGARPRPLGDAWAWGRKGNAEISPLVAVTLARWVYQARAHAYDPGDYDVAQSIY